jgi:hypothetical protein
MRRHKGLVWSGAMGTNTEGFSKKLAEFFQVQII